MGKKSLGIKGINERKGFFFSLGWSLKLIREIKKDTKICFKSFLKVILPQMSMVTERKLTLPVTL